MNEEEKWLAKAFQMGKNSIVDFKRLFLPADDDVAPAKYHYEWDNILRNGTKNFAIEAFRESAKSTLVIRAHTLYRLVYPSKDYDYLVFIKANQKEASKKLKEIEYEYLTNPMLCANLVNVREQSEKAFEVNVKDLDNNVINVRIEAYGKGSPIRGLLHIDRRPKLVVIDDPQDVDDSLSETIMDNDYEWFLSDVYFLSQKGRVFMIGNNLGAKCLIERVIENADSLNFEAQRIPILDEQGNSAWPEKFPVEQILEQKENFRNLGKLDIWVREKMCVAISPESQRFKKENFRYYSEKDIKKYSLSHFITVDLAISEKKSADYTCICVVGVNYDNHWFIRDMIYGRFDPSETIDKIFEAVVKYRPIYVGIEKVAYQAALQHFIVKEMPKRNVFFTIKELKADRKKELRIEAIQPRFIAGTVWFPENAHFLAELESELLSFPRGIHDDLIDALAYIPQIAIAPNRKSNVVYIPFAGQM